MKESPQHTTHAMDYSRTKGKAGMEGAQPPLLKRAEKLMGQATHPMQLTERDRQVVQLVARAGALRGDQIQTAYFSLRPDDSRCQRRLTLLVQHRFLDRLPRQANEPAIYIISRRSRQGRRLLAHHRVPLPSPKLGPLPHLLGINELLVRVLRGCQDLGYALSGWQRSHELEPLLAKDKLIPDSYFQIARVVAGEWKTAAFFLELEHTSRDSSVLASKLTRYQDLYYPKQGDDESRYTKLFGTRALRVLFVYTGANDQIALARVRRGVEEAAKRAVTIARFISLRQVQTISPVDLLVQPIWFAPSSSDPVSLFQSP